MRNGLTRFAVILLLMTVSSTIALAQATQESADKPLSVETRVYDLRDLMMNVGDYPFPGRIGAPAGREVVLLPDAGSSKPSTQPTRQERVSDLVRLITDTVEADSWRDAGGTYGAIREISGLLVVTQTADAHKQIGTLLGQLREDHLRTIRAQAMWIMLTPEQANALLPSDQKSDGKVSARSIDAAALAKMPADIVKFRAELSCFSGQTVSIAAGRSRTAIVAQDAVVAQNAAVLSPTVKPVQVGAMLEMTPTLETTLDTAVVDVHSQVADWSAETPTKIATRATAADPASGVQTGGEAPATIDRLNLLTQEFRTTSRLPVGKPVLIGGMSSEPSQSGPESSQLYLVIQLTAGK